MLKLKSVSQLLFTIFNRDEYVPREAHTIPNAAITTLRITCLFVALFPTIFRKQKAGKTIATSTLRREPIKAITSPKNGIRKAAQTVDITNAVLRRRKHQLVREMLSGNNSSKLLASGFIIKAYLVSGIIAIVHKETLEANASRGRSNVI